ncbi:Isochorismatase-like protein [Paraphysoderma sedebokerense]|nr:Isochorismatase-like protein [Paraphysoderma sedebokerense]
MNPPLSLLKRTAQLSPSNTAFFLCDIQERFRSLIYHFPSVVSTAQKMAEASNVLSVPLIVTEQNPKALGSTVPEIDITKAALTIPKTKFSMCVEQVDTFLKERNIQNVILFGIESHVCVAQTTVDLLNSSVDVHILQDGVSSMNPGEIPVALKRLQNLGATITTSDALLFQLLRDAKHDNFKAISGLVKKYTEETKKNVLLNGLSSSL